MRVIIQPQSPPCVTIHIFCQNLHPTTDKGRTIFIVPKLEHELVACLSVLRQAETFLLRAGREAIVRERGSHDMEGWGLFTAIGK